ncbi:hypothetical protein P67b_00003 [Ruegeria phage Tedan]|nr:hypothetical protein P67b_00003 [Ruegeria phage Tedan]
MVWVTLALFALSFIATALLQPRPDIEDARAEQLDPDNFPRATENAPAPIILGRVRYRGPNTQWYGGFRPEPITEKIKTGLFSSERVTTGFRYFLTLDMGLCLGPLVDLHGIYIDSEQVFSGGASGGDPIEQNVGTLGGPTANPADKTNPPTFTTFLGSWVAQPPDALLTFDLLDVFPSQEVIDELVATGDLQGRVAIEGFWWDLFAGVPGIGSTTLNLAFFQDNGADAPDLANPIGEASNNRSDTGAVTQTVSTLAIPTNTTGLRHFAIRFTITRGPFADLFFNNARQGSPLLTADIIHTFRETISGNIFAPNLFGGEGAGGGWIGNFTFYRGTFTQPVDPAIANLLGSADALPAYRGEAHIVLNDNFIGEQASLRSMEFDLSCYTNLLGLSTRGFAFTGSEDISPAEALATLTQDEWRGLSVDPGRVNEASLVTAGNTLIAERHGVSMSLATSREGSAHLREILRQIDGVLVENQNGEAELRLIRNDYDPNTTPVFDEDDISAVRNFSRSTWGDVVTEVKVSYPFRDRPGSRVAIAQNMATLNMVGERRTVDISFPMCYDKTLANALAARELARRSIPLIKLTVEMNRSGYTLAVTDVVRITLPEYGLTELVCRVQKVSLGTLRDNRVTVELLQDVFAAADVVFTEPEDSSWISDRTEPLIIPTFEVVEQPFFYSSRVGEFPAEDGEGSVIPFALQPQASSTGFTFNSDIVTGEPLGYFDPEQIAYPTTATLTANYSVVTGFETGLDAPGITIENVSGTPTSATLAAIRNGSAGILYLGGEWLAYETATDNGDDTWTLSNVRRAILGTQPLAHVAGDRMWILSAALLGSAQVSAELVDDGTLYHKFLDQVGPERLDPSLATENNITLQRLADRPLRPRNLQIDGSRSEVPYDASVDPTIDLTWVNSNRAASQIAFEDDITEVPDQVEEYDVEIWIDDVQDLTRSQTNVTSPHSIDFTGAGGSAGEIRLYSRRTGGNTLRSAYYAVYPFTLGNTMDSTLIRMDETTITMDRT